VPFWPKKVEIYRAHAPLPMPQVMDVARLKTIKYKLHIKTGPFLFMHSLMIVNCVDTRNGHQSDPWPL
jgi:hypothetical protein